MDRKGKPVQRVEFIRESCRGKRVLHLGCTNWPYTEASIADGMLLHASLKSECSELYGLDSDTEGIELLRKHGFQDLYEGDLENLESTGLDRAFEVIIAGEMIEHLNNPGRFLAGIQRFMNEETQLVLTTINAYCAMRFFSYAFRGKRGLNEPVHPDHVSYYSYSTLKLLLKRHGFAVNEFHFYDIGQEHRPTNPFYLNKINDIAVRIFPQLADGLIAVCTLSK